MTTIVVQPFTAEQAEYIRSIAASHAVSDQAVLTWLVREGLRRELLKDFRKADLISSDPSQILAT